MKRLLCRPRSAVCGLITVLCAASAMGAAQPLTYEDMLKLYPNADKLRMPTKEEMEKLGPRWPKIPPEENAAYYYALAVSLVKGLGHSWAEPMGSASSAEPYAGDKAAFAAWISDNGPALEAVKKASTLPACEFPWFYDKVSNGVDSSRSPVVQLRHLARTISDAAFLEELENRPEAAAQWDLTNIGLARHMRPGTMDWDLVGMAIESMGQIALYRLIANADLSEPTLRKIIEAARGAESSTQEVRDMLAQEESFVAEAKWPDEDQTGAKDMRREIERFLNVPLYEYLAEEGVRKASQANTTHDAHEQLVLQAFHLREHFGQMDANLRSLQICAAVALFRKKNGRLPEKLDDLVPAFLPAVPLDPFSGKPLRFAKTDDGWKAWSVGVDLKDDGGVTTGTWPWTWEGPDAVFPSKVPDLLATKARLRNVPAGTPEPPPNATGAELLRLTPLHYAANRGDAVEVARLLDAGADVKAKGNWDQTPLHLAVTAEVAKLLLAHGADPMAASANHFYNVSPLGWAIAGGRKDVVEMFLNTAAVRASPDYGRALEWAVSDDKPDIVLLLIKLGWNVDDVLHQVVQSGTFSLAEKVLSAHVAPDAGLVVAMQERRWEMADFFVSKGAKMDIFVAATLGKVDAARRMIEANPAVVKLEDEYDWTALHWAAFAGRKEMAALLLSKGADANNKDCGDTPLHVVAAISILESIDVDSAGVIEELFKKGAELNAKNDDGLTPLHLAIREGNLLAAQALLKKGADAGIKDDAGKTALDYAKETGNANIVELVEKKGEK